MTSDADGNYTNAYTYGLDRISIDKLSPDSDSKTDPLFYLYDGRGSVSDATNSLGQVKDKYRYDPYGQVNHGGFWGSNATHYENFYGYNGEDYNRLSGLEYLRARYYEPESGRFLTRDSYLGDVMQPLTLNRYAYALNNPMMYTDPSGHWPGWLDKAASAVSSFASNVVDTVSSYASKAVSYVEDAVSTGWTNVKNAYNYVADTVSGWYNSGKQTVKSYASKVEEKISSAKRDISNTANKVVQLAKPVISTINYPNEVVRKAIETVKKGCEGAKYVASQAYKYKEQILDGVQLGLDLAGFVPGVGDLLDGANGVISLARGNKSDAALSFAAMIPFAGSGATLAKLAKKGENAIEIIKTADNALDVAKDGEKALDLAKVIEKNADEISEVGTQAKSQRWLDAEEKLAKAAQGSGGSGGVDFIATSNGTAVHASQTDMINSITNAGATRIGPTSQTSEIGEIFQMNTKHGPMEIRVMPGQPGTTSAFKGPRTINTIPGTGTYVYPNGERIIGAVSKSDRKLIGHIHGQRP
ncbi:RHS repeat-associated core domain-containing protein [Clostridium fungisolvens]|uniref:RHS repeat-associated core domain-containing protein n=1 Tax=Clostridium fungisolvens TaxID=1604897 RepID=A0A6V8SMN0_9CLOT|nr:RHS repeat-associated core domain-containing protein [Clostridium fungisolvens]GFP78427.1 hypothetical protein bsdtw1_04651 [Clostridium fungisolvens]